MSSNQIRASSAFKLSIEIHLEGSIAFGLVNIPVRLYSATESQNLASHMLHKKDLSRIRFQRVAESTRKEVPAEEIIKGYEVEKNQYVILADESSARLLRRDLPALRSRNLSTRPRSPVFTSKNRIISNPTRVRARLLLFYGKR
jgi:Ku70/Ku80 beta-barrel domain